MPICTTYGMEDYICREMDSWPVVHLLDLALLICLWREGPQH